MKKDLGLVQAVYPMPVLIFGNCRKNRQCEGCCTKDFFLHKNSLVQQPFTFYFVPKSKNPISGITFIGSFA